MYFSYLLEDNKIRTVIHNIPEDMDLILLVKKIKLQLKCSGSITYLKKENKEYDDVINNDKNIECEKK